MVPKTHDRLRYGILACMAIAVIGAFVFQNHLIMASLVVLISTVAVFILVGFATKTRFVIGGNLTLHPSTKRNLQHPAQIVLFVVSKRNREYIIGDLEEEYRTTHKRFPRWWYCGQVITLVASYWWATLRRQLGFDVVLKMIRK